MLLEAGFIKLLVVESLTAPRQAARRIMALGTGLPVALMAIGCAGVLSALMLAVLGLELPNSGNPGLDAMMTQPIAVAFSETLGLLIVGGMISGLGRLFGGKGRLDQAFILIAWWDFLTLVLQLAESLVQLLLPPLAGPVALFVLVISTWALVSFIAELHGFRSAFAVLPILAGVLLLIGIALVPYVSSL